MVDFIGGSSSDVFVASGSGNRYFGNGGNDTLIAGSGSFVFRGGAGDDTVSFARSLSPVRLVLSNDQLQLIGGSQFVQILEVENFIGSPFADTVSARNGPGRIEGGLGNDSITGNFWADTLLGGDGNDYIAGGNGDDVLGGDAGDDTLVATIAGADTLNGDAGNDSLVGGGFDRLFGGSGNDTLATRGGDFVLDGGSGYDLISLAGLSAAVRLDGTTKSHGGAAAGVQLSGFEEIHLTTFSDYVRVGNWGALVIRAGDGNDSIDSGWSNDVVHGDGGNDRLDMGGGNDTMDGGPGADTLIGGPGGDRFVLALASDSGAMAGTRDTWADFGGAGDVGDLGQVDADRNTPGDQAFRLILGQFTGRAGELRLENGVIYGDTNGDKLPDFAINAPQLNSLSDVGWVL